MEDLFKDDQPLILPKIKGLDDYVPAEDFFDEELMERVEKAESEEIQEEDKPSKAGRNIPKQSTDQDSIPKKNLVKKPLNNNSPKKN